MPQGRGYPTKKAKGRKSAKATKNLTPKKGKK